MHYLNLSFDSSIIHLAAKIGALFFLYSIFTSIMKELKHSVCAVYLSNSSLWVTSSVLMK